jgi:hypothetical protein
MLNALSPPECELPVSGMADRYFAILDILDEGWPIDGVTDILSDAASFAMSMVLSTSSITFADVAAKLRVLATMAEAGDDLEENVGLVNDVIEEWLRVYATEEALRRAAWRAGA